MLSITSQVGIVFVVFYLIRFQLKVFRPKAKSQLSLNFIVGAGALLLFKWQVLEGTDHFNLLSQPFRYS